MRFHIWGVSSRQYLDSLPAYSADSSGILGQPYRYGRLHVFDPASARMHQIEIRGGREVYRLGPVLRGVYGVDPSDIATAHPGNLATLIQVAVAATQQYAAWLQARHQVTPPTWGINPETTMGPGLRVHVTGKNDGLRRVAGPGPSLHLADTDHTHLLRAVTG